MCIYTHIHVAIGICTCVYMYIPADTKVIKAEYSMCMYIHTCARMYKYVPSVHSRMTRHMHTRMCRLACQDGQARAY